MSDTISISVTPGYQFPTDGSVALNYDLLNLLGTPTVDLTGAVGALSLADGSVITVKLGNNALAASSTGRGKMQDGFFNNDATSRAKFVASFFGASDATSLAFFEDLFWPASATGRGKFAAGFVTGRELDANASPIISASRNLLAFNNAATPNSKVDVTADELVLKDASNRMYLARSVSLTIDITASGVNGLDAGAEGSSTWYYIWVIYNGTTVSGLLSASATAPTLPATYTHKALIGEVRNDGSSNFLTFYRQDRDVFLNDTALFTAKAAAGADTFESYQAGGGGTDVDLRTLIPPSAKRMRGNAGNSNTGNDHILMVAADANGLGAVAAVGSHTGSALNSFSLAVPFDIPLKTAQTFYWKALNTTARGRITITGYTT